MHLYHALFDCYKQNILIYIKIALLGDTHLASDMEVAKFIYICFRFAFHPLLLTHTDKVISRTEQTGKHDAVALWYAATVVN